MLVSYSCRIVSTLLQREFIMLGSARVLLFSVTAVAALLLVETALAADASALRPPAGQVCPEGSFVIGFDKESNILCSETCGNGVLNEGEACDDGNTGSGDRCSADCSAESMAAVVPAVAAEKAVSAAPSQPVAPVASAAPVLQRPFVEDIDPSTAVWGVNEVVVTILGSGFGSQTTVRFQGSTYAPSVNQSGTEMRVTLTTRGLGIGRYAITVSNGPDMDVTVKKGLEIY